MSIDFTGKRRYRKTFFDTLVLQLEYRYEYSESAFNANDIEYRIGWKDATAEDLSQTDNDLAVV